MKLWCEKLWRLISVCAGMIEFMSDLGRPFDILREDQVKFYESYCMKQIQKVIFACFCNIAKGQNVSTPRYGTIS